MAPAKCTKYAGNTAYLYVSENKEVPECNIGERSVGKYANDRLLNVQLLSGNVFKKRNNFCNFDTV
jgi:hypothetical protein